MGKEPKESPANVLVDQGLNQYLQDNFDRAITLWQSALKLDPANSRAKQFLTQAATEKLVAGKRVIRATCDTFQAVTPDFLQGKESTSEFDNFIDDLSEHTTDPTPPDLNPELAQPILTRSVERAVLEEKLEQPRSAADPDTQAISFAIEETTPSHMVKLDHPSPQGEDEFKSEFVTDFEGEEQTPTHLLQAASRTSRAAGAARHPVPRVVDPDLDRDELTPTHLTPSGTRAVPRRSPQASGPPSDQRIAGQGVTSQEELDDLVITVATDLEGVGQTEDSDPLDDIPITLDVQQERSAPRLADSPRIITPNTLRAPSPGQLIAMDFGTTRSRVAAMVNGKIHVIPLHGGTTEIPSVVGIRPNGTMVVGYEARDMLATDPANVIPYPRRVIGQLYRNPQIAGYLANLAMHTSEWSNGRIIFHAQGREYTAPQLCAPILQTLRLAAEHFIGERITEVVLTTPLGFNSTQIQALALAAELAGLEVTQFVEEPVAAALANRTDPAFHNMVGVYDFGGGTFDYSVINLENNRAKVITAAGDTWLGGEDFEETLANTIADNFWRKHQIEVRNSKVQWQRLLVRAEQAKQELSEKPLVNLTLPEAALTSKGQLDITFPISRTKFVELSRSLINRSLATCQEALDKEGLKVSDLSAIYLSSGTTLIPAVQDAVVDFFQQVPRFAVPPERAVLLGSLLAARMRNK